MYPIWATGAISPTGAAGLEQRNTRGTSKLSQCVKQPQGRTEEEGLCRRSLLQRFPLLFAVCSGCEHREENHTHKTVAHSQSAKHLERRASGRGMSCFGSGFAVSKIDLDHLSPAQNPPCRAKLQMSLLSKLQRQNKKISPVFPF